MEYVKQTIAELFTKNAKENGDEVFVVYDGINFTWKEIYFLSRKLAIKSNQVCKLNKGDYVGIYASNSVDWLVNFFALQLIGVKTILFNPHHKYDTMHNMIQKHKIKLILYANNEDNINFFKTIKLLEQSKDIDCKFRNIKTSEAVKKSLIREANDEKMNFLEVFSDYDDTAAVIFTSGSTGVQKGVMLSHYNLLNNAKSVCELMNWKCEDRVCISVPFFHCFGLTTCILSSVITRFKLCIIEDISTESISRCIEENKCTILNGVPTMFLAIVRKSCHKRFDLSHLDSGIIAGSPIYPADYKEISAALKSFHLQPSYGQSETSPCISLSRLEDSTDIKAKNVGKLIDDVEVRIRDINTNEIIEEGIGEIETRGYQVMKGYLNDEEQTRAVFSEDSWLKTGDLGYLDKNDYLHIEGRKKNLIIRCGENISPVMIENYIKKFDNRLETVVLGKKVDVLQEEVVACIIDYTEKDVELEELKKYLDDKLPWYAVPKYFLFFENVKRTSVGKVDLKHLSEQVDELLS